MKRSPLPLALSALIAASLLAGGAWLDRQPEPDGPPGSVQVEGQRPESDEAPSVFVSRVADGIIDHQVELTSRGRSLGKFSLRQLGAHADTQSLLAALEQRARSESIETSLPIVVDSDALARRLSEPKEDGDQSPLPARRLIDSDAHKDETTQHREGSYLDIFGATERLLTAAKRGEASVEAPVFKWVPAATSERVAATDAGKVISAFETRFGGPPGRNGNIERAASLLDGLLLMPGETVSFNETVGPRTVENGFFMAPEIYKGEIRAGIGGGACQVASTLHAAAFFGGFDVTDRINHSRPSAYIRPGLDATVSFPVLDLRIKNPFDFAVVVSARAQKGVLRFELLGKEPRVDVTLATETKGLLKYSRKLEKAALPEGEFRIKQKGKRGMSLRKVKTTKLLATGETKVEETTDVYPPTQEIYLVAPGLKPDDLPPLEDPPSGA